MSQNTPLRSLPREAYTIGWVCAIYIELTTARAMFDERHGMPELLVDDGNVYNFGRIRDHNVVTACLPAGQIGTGYAAIVATRMQLSFPGIRFFLMVGVAGGVPGGDVDIRLGDVVVSVPEGLNPGVVQYGAGKVHPGRFERTGSLPPPPERLLQVVQNIRARHAALEVKILEYAKKFEDDIRLHSFTKMSIRGEDVLFRADYQHAGGDTCHGCDKTMQVPRPQREQAKVHYGTVASGDHLMRDATERDRISAELKRVLCFEMEAAGLMIALQCLVIRGICDYADSHKNKGWQKYAAGMAAAYAKEVLTILPASATVSRLPPAPTEEAVNPRAAGRVGATGRLPYTNYELPPPISSNSIGSGLNVSNSAAVGSPQNFVTPNFSGRDLNIVVNMPNSGASTSTEPGSSRNTRGRPQTSRREAENIRSVSSFEGWDRPRGRGRDRVEYGDFYESPARRPGRGMSEDYEVICFKCDTPGHIAADCNRRDGFCDNCKYHCPRAKLIY
ncbi:hypothetical protein TWF481_010704 [Arthrobotrys musiformis]|uniref:CCHC-type domain-containing protein n=1 Tax=Arthrobotrys musiformis TaxID=47236 RepID=A0AAV9W3P9_9PEZI